MNVDMLPFLPKINYRSCELAGMMITWLVSSFTEFFDMISAGRFLWISRCELR